MMNDQVALDALIQWAFKEITLKVVNARAGDLFNEIVRSYLSSPSIAFRSFLKLTEAAAKDQKHRVERTLEEATNNQSTVKSPPKKKPRK
jgi:hypothetical protein